MVIQENVLKITLQTKIKPTKTLRRQCSVADLLNEGELWTPRTHRPLRASAEMIRNIFSRGRGKGRGREREREREERKRERKKRVKEERERQRERGREREGELPATWQISSATAQIPDFFSRSSHLGLFHPRPRC